jgi:hypothetical protein
VLRYLLQLVVVIAPLISGQWSLLDFLDRRGILVEIQADPSDPQKRLATIAGFTGPKEEVEFDLRLGIAGLLFVVSLVEQWRNVGKPLERLRSFRTAFLDNEWEKHWKPMLGAGCRMNVTYLKRSVTSAGLKVFRWAWHKGFDPPFQADADLFMFSWQGVWGEAVRQASKGAHEGDVKGTIAKLGPGSPDQKTKRYWMFPWQVSKTTHVKTVLCVPILRKEKGMGGAVRFVCVGLVTVDAVTQEASEKLTKNAKEVMDFFSEMSPYLADLE